MLTFRPPGVPNFKLGRSAPRSSATWLGRAKGYQALDLSGGIDRDNWDLEVALTNAGDIVGESLQNLAVHPDDLRSDLCSSSSALDLLHQVWSEVLRPGDRTTRRSTPASDGRAAFFVGRALATMSRLNALWSASSPASQPHPEFPKDVSLQDDDQGRRKGQKGQVDKSGARQSPPGPLQSGRPARASGAAKRPGRFLSHMTTALNERVTEPGAVTTSRA